MARKIINWPDLIEKAKKFVIEKQAVSFTLLYKEFKVSSSSVMKLLDFLVSHGVVAKAKEGNWVVLIEGDGVTRRPPPELYVAEKKKSRKGGKHKAGTARVTPASQVTQATFSQEEKLAKLRELAVAVGPGHTANLLLAAANDLSAHGDLVEIIQRIRGNTR